MPSAAPRHGFATPRLNLGAARARLRAQLEELAHKVDAVRRDEEFTAALRAMARFWRYSLINQALIRMQRPDARRVASLRTWEALGRRVLPGRPGLHVFAPSRRRGGAVQFVAVQVFDIRDTRGRRLRPLDLSLRGRSRHVGTLEHAARTLGITVENRVLPAGIGGISTGGRVVIAHGLRGRERAATLAHELAHELLHQAERKRRMTLKRPGPLRTRTQIETEADATAFVVLSALGLPSKAPTYIAWQGGDGATVLRSMTRIQRAAQAILTATGLEER